MMLNRPPRVTGAVAPSPYRPFSFENDQLLLIAVAILLLQDGASLLLVLILLYIAVF